MREPRLIGADAIAEALSYEDLIEPVAAAFAAFSEGRAGNGVVMMYRGSDRAAGDTMVKTATVAGHPFHVVRIAPWFAANVAAGRPQGGLLVVLDSATGHTLAVKEDRHRLSDLRTAAAGAIAARHLAPRSVTRAAVLDAGVQAYWQARALHSERPLETLAIWARDAAKAEALAGQLRHDLPGVSIAVTGREAAIRKAEVIVTATGARDPILPGAWLSPGQHVTAVGADDPTKCELGAEALRRARVFVDERATAEATGDVLRAIRGDGYDPDRVAGEIGEVIAGRLPGRRSDDEITVATFSGIGAQDLAAVEALRVHLKPWRCVWVHIGDGPPSVPMNLIA